MNAFTCSYPVKVCFGEALFDVIRAFALDRAAKQGSDHIMRFIKFFNQFTLFRLDIAINIR